MKKDKIKKIALGLSNNPKLSRKFDDSASKLEEVYAEIAYIIRSLGVNPYDLKIEDILQIDKLITKVG